jgi:hypothetical protein
MVKLGRRLGGVLATLLVLSMMAPMAVRADVNGPLIINSEVLATTGVPESRAAYHLVVQATSWVGSPYRYVLTVGNFSPWPMIALHILDRYVPGDATPREIDHEWFPKRLDPGQVASTAIEFPDGPLPDGCHQIEISLAAGLGTVLMDCSAPGATTIWDVPLSEAMQSYLTQPPLTRTDPEGRSKLGIHVTNRSVPNLAEFIARAQPAVVVAVEDVGWLAEVKAASPQTVTIARFMETNQALEGDPVERANEFVANNAKRYLENPAVDYWLGWNEPVIDGVEQMKWFAAFEVARTEAMAKLGLKAAVGNFGVGNPEADEFGAFLPAVAVAKEYGGILAVHEYAAPTLHDGVGAGIPGLEASSDYGALTLRYRYWYDHYLRVKDLVVPVVITEAGIDGGVLRSESSGLAGWRDFAPNWPEAASHGIVDLYAEQLSWYDDQLRRDPYVLGFAIFNVGDIDGKWKSFDVTEILPQLANLIASKG